MKKFHLNSLFSFFSIIFGICIALMPQAHALDNDFSMHSCMLLPITDSVENAISFKVYEEVENYLKESDWCYYKSNSELLNLLGDHHKNLKSHLRNPEVLKLIAEKVKAGSMIRANLESQIDGIDVDIEIIGSNGSDVLFKEKTHLPKDNVPMIAQTIINWLMTFEKNIPYDGRILGVLGNQFTIDIGKSSHVRIGSSVVVRRPIKKKMHPLFKEVVEWESVVLGTGNIVSVSEFQAVAILKQKYIDNKSLQKDDWVRIERLGNKENENDVEFKFPDVKENEFGKLGTAVISMIAGQGTANSRKNYNGSMGGVVYGGHGLVELWATRNFWGSLELGAVFGSYTKDQGNLTVENSSYSSSVFKLKGGIKYLPMGFFYGPQVDLYTGYGRYSYGMDISPENGLGENSFSGILFGTRLSAPLLRALRGMLRLDWIPFPTYEEKSVIHGGSKSESSIQLELGAEYIYSPIMSLIGTLQTTTNKAQFSNSAEISYKETAGRFGVLFTF